MEPAPESKSREELLNDLEALHRQVEESTETLRAIRAGEVDAFVLAERGGERVYLLKSADLVSEILEQAVDAIVVCDPAGTVVRVSRGVYDLCEAEPVGRSFEAALPIRIAAEAGCPPFGLDAVLEGRILRGVPVALDRPGGELHFQLSAGPLIDARKHIVGCLVTMTDVTERERAEQALRETDRRKDEFLAVLGHELRNPIAAATSAVGVLEALPERGSGKARELFAILERQLSHLSRLVDDVLDVTRLNSGKIELRSEIVDLETIVERTLEPLRATGRLAGRTVTTDLQSAPVRGDAMRLEQILGNLLDNAIKYSREGDRIRIKLERQPGEAALLLEDTGRGIPPEMLPRVFDLFTQDLHAQGRWRGGLGIGLAIVRHLVTLHGGTIEASSAGLGQGSRFVVRLPLAETAGAAASAGTAGARAGRRRILVVEDYADARMALRHLLESMGHEVETAEDGRRALELALSWRPEVALVDIDLPDLDGYELARRLRATAEGKRVRLIALTGYGRARDQRRAVEAGFDGHATKPLQSSELSRLLGDPAKPPPS